MWAGLPLFLYFMAMLFWIASKSFPCCRQEQQRGEQEIRMRRWTDYHYKSVWKKKKKRMVSARHKKPPPHKVLQKSCFYPQRSKTPTADAPSSGYQFVPPSQQTPGLWQPWKLLLWSQPWAPTVRLSPGRKSRSLPLLSQKKVQKHISGQKDTHKNIPAAKNICVVKSMHEGPGKATELPCLGLSFGKEAGKTITLNILVCLS